MPFFPGTSNITINGSQMIDVAGDHITYNGVEPPLHALLKPVDDATYDRATDTGRVARCYQGTREGVIAEIVRWSEAKDSPPICWLSGPAGSGKSAISQTMAEKFAAQRRLAASFFFLRGMGRRSAIAGLIPTLAHSLSASVPSTKPAIQNLLKHDPRIASSRDRSLRSQLQELIAKPYLQRPITIIPFRQRTKPRVVVIDALDECDDRELMVEFIEVLIDVLSENQELQLRFLVTSRVEEHLRVVLSTEVAHAAVHHMSLQDYNARVDIRQFFRAQFDAIRHAKALVMKDVPCPWPLESDLELLVQRTNGLFIFAATLMKYVDQGHGLPQDRLQKALSSEAGLDDLYKQVLSDAQCDHGFDHIVFNRVLGTIMVLCRSIPITEIGQLLDLRPAHIVNTLLGAQSILMIPGSDDKPIQLFHTSLRDFLTSKSRAGQYFINPPAHHFSITTDCLACMLVQPVEGIFYEGARKYASLNWCHHFHQSVVGWDDNILMQSSTGFLSRALEDFTTHSMDFWINTILLEGSESLLDTLDLTLLVLTQLSQFPEDLVEVIKNVIEHAKVKENTPFMFTNLITKH